MLGAASIGSAGCANGGQTPAKAADAKVSDANVTDANVTDANVTDASVADTKVADAGASDAAKTGADAANVGTDTASNDAASGSDAKAGVEPGIDFPKLAKCPQTWAMKPFDWATRPSSGRLCAKYAGPGITNATHYRCLPWEWCEKGFGGGPFVGPAKLDPTGSLRCMRHCGKPVSCPPGGVCNNFLVSGGDVSTKHALCLIPKSLGSFPAYVTAAPPPAEGGLSCWTELFQAQVANQSLRMARVGPHIYLLLFGAQSGTSAKPNTPLVSHTLMHIGISPKMTAAQLTTVDSVKGSNDAIIAVVPSGNELVAFRRPAAAPYGYDKPAVQHTVVVAKPAADGGVSFNATGVSVSLKFGANATLTGSRHGCLLVPHGKDLARVCFVREGGKLVQKTLPLKLPAVAQLALASSTAASGSKRMQNLNPWRAAVSNQWIVVATGAVCGGDTQRLHVAPFDRKINVITGKWTTTEMLKSWPGHALSNLPDNLCNALGPLWISGDVVYSSGMTTRISKGKTGVWHAATVLPRAFGYFSGWDEVNGFIVAAFRVKTLGKTVPISIVINRVLW